MTIKYEKKLIYNKFMKNNTGVIKLREKNYKEKKNL